MSRPRVIPLTDADLVVAIADPRNLRRWQTRLSRCSFFSPTGCLIFCKYETAYSQFALLIGDRRVVIGSHRVALMLKLGRPLRAQALHSCDHGACISELHLWEGTQLDNMRDASRKGRLACDADMARAELLVDLSRRAVEFRAEMRSLFAAQHEATP